MNENSNFYCECGEEYQIVKYSFSYKNGEKIYIKDKKQLICEKCGDYLKYKEEEIKGNLGFNYGKFQSMSPLDKQAFLKKRSQADAKKNKYVDQEREKSFYNAKVKI